MKLLSMIFLAMTFALLVACGGKQSGGPTAESGKMLAKLVLSSMVKNDEESFENFIINGEDLVQFYSSKLKNKGSAKYPLNSEDLERLKKNIKRMKDNECYVKTRSSYFRIKDSFARIRKKAEKAGVNWKQAQFVDVDIANKRTRYNIAHADIYLQFKSGDKSWDLKIDDVVRTKRGWVIGDKLVWRGEYQAPDNQFKNSK